MSVCTGVCTVCFQVSMFGYMLVCMYLDLFAHGYGWEEVQRRGEEEWAREQSVLERIALVAFNSASSASASAVCCINESESSSERKQAVELRQVLFLILPLPLFSSFVARKCFHVFQTHGKGFEIGTIPPPRSSDPFSSHWSNPSWTLWYLRWQLNVFLSHMHLKY